MTAPRKQVWRSESLLSQEMCHDYLFCNDHKLKAVQHCCKSQTIPGFVKSFLHSCIAGQWMQMEYQTKMACLVPSHWLDAENWVIYFLLTITVMRITVIIDKLYVTSASWRESRVRCEQQRTNLRRHRETINILCAFIQVVHRIGRIFLLFNVKLTVYILLYTHPGRAEEHLRRPILWFIRTLQNLYSYYLP